MRLMVLSNYTYTYEVLVHADALNMKVVNTPIRCNRHALRGVSGSFGSYYGTCTPCFVVFSCTPATRIIQGETYRDLFSGSDDFDDSVE